MCPMCPEWKGALLFPMAKTINDNHKHMPWISAVGSYFQGFFEDALFFPLWLAISNHNRVTTLYDKAKPLSKGAQGPCRHTEGSIFKNKDSDLQHFSRALTFLFTIIGVPFFNKIRKKIRFHSSLNFMKHQQSLFIKLSKQHSVTLERFSFLFEPLQQHSHWLMDTIIYECFAFNSSAHQATAHSSQWHKPVTKQWLRETF